MFIKRYASGPFKALYEKNTFRAIQLLKDLRPEINRKGTKELPKSGSSALKILETVTHGLAEGTSRAILDKQ